MQLSEILIPAAVRDVSGASSKKRLFLQLGDIAAQAYGLDAGRCVDALLERESLGPTGVGKGIALPHARLDDLDKVRGVFLHLEKPLEYDSVDRQPVDLVFALFAPKNAGVEHLKALATVSRLMRDPGIAAKLRANSDPVALHAILTEAPSTRAA